MQKRRFFILLAVCVVAVVMWFILTRKTEKAVPAVIRNQTTSPSQTSVSSAPALATPPPTAESQKRRFLAAYLTPISFYGKVVDQHGEPVFGADIILAANDKPLGGNATEYTRKSDRTGLFSISEIRGVNLGVEVSKLGYLGIPPDDLKITSSGVFEYGVPSVTGPRLPDQSNPAIFTLHKIGILEPLVKIGEKNFRIRRDGTPLLISLNGKNSHQVVLRCWTKDLGRPEGQNKYDWNFEIAPKDGGIQIRKDGFGFEAPTEGYQPYDTIDMPATLPFGFGGWDSNVNRSYFIRFDDQTFARVNLTMVAGGDHFVVWESYYNPKPNSRNLEYDATKPNPTP